MTALCQHIAPRWNAERCTDAEEGQCALGDQQIGEVKRKHDEQRATECGHDMSDQDRKRLCSGQSGCTDIVQREDAQRFGVDDTTEYRPGQQAQSQHQRPESLPDDGHDADGGYESGKGEGDVYQSQHRLPGQSARFRRDESEYRADRE